MMIYYEREVTVASRQGGEFSSIGLMVHERRYRGESEEREGGVRREKGSD